MKSTHLYSFSRLSCVSRTYKKEEKTSGPPLPTTVYFLSVNSDRLKIKVDRLSNITINKAGLLFIFRLNTTAFKAAYVCFWKYFFVTVAICYFVVTDLYGNLKNFCFNAV